MLNEGGVSLALQDTLQALADPTRRIRACRLVRLVIIFQYQVQQFQGICQF